MATIPKSYMLSHDLDWFFHCDSIIVHCASNGSIIPMKANDNNNVHFCQEIISSAPDQNCEILTDEYYEREYIDPNINRLIERLGDNETYSREELKKIYYSSFKSMARRGIWSFDYSYKEQKYLLVARPAGHIDINRLLYLPHPTGRKLLSDYITTFDNLHISEENTSFNLNEII